MVRAAAALVLLAGIVTSFPRHPSPALQPAVLNDNLTPGGTRTGGTLRISLEIRPADWRPLGKDHAGREVLAFGEAGKPAQLPGPMIRVPVGTVVRVTLANRSDSTVVVRGLTGHVQAVPDTVVVPAGQTRNAVFTADAEGTYFYYGARVGTAFGDRGYLDDQLQGALIVDPPGGAKPDRVFVISQALTGLDSAGRQEYSQELLSINGRPWPLTERLTYQVGDSVRWRWINASANVHPLHLHGFYYRIDARGDFARDTVYWPAQQRMAVTEMVDAEQTMRMVWSPNRPGGWIFHCHLTFHILSNPPLGSEAIKDDQYEEMVLSHSHENANHVERAMGGLMLAMYVKPTGPPPPVAAGRKVLRLLVQSGRLPGDTARHYSYLLPEGGDPPRDSVRRWAPTLVLHQGEPTSIWVINRLDQPTAVHWHGLEIESPFDGVVGVGGYKGSPVPPIMPGDSFEVRVTPPRSGSFMYHTHMAELIQQPGGLWGPLLVLDSGTARDPEHDLVFQAGAKTPLRATLNGTDVHDTLTMKVGVRYRLRMMNVTFANPFLQFALVRNGAPVAWEPLARDGFDLPAWQRGEELARVPMGIGETKDFALTPDRAGILGLEVRGGAGNLVTRWPIKVVAP